jgi:hypothetical protein
MYKLEAGDFHHAVSHLAGLAAFIDAGKRTRAPHEECLDEAKVIIKESLEKLLPHLQVLRADSTWMDTDRWIRNLSNGDPVTWDRISEAIRNIGLRLQDEMTLRHVYVLDDRRSNYFSASAKMFGDELAVKFPSALYDIDEAGKCYSLDRPTASVFHLMRVMEIGIRALARCLDVPDPLKPAERNWAIVLKSISENGLDRLWPKAADRMSGDGAFFESMRASLDSVRNPWRNATMHVESKYTSDEAEHIFVAVKGFMKKLASRCDENGQPKA